MSSPNSAMLSPGMRLRISNFESQRFLCFELPNLWLLPTLAQIPNKFKT
jgi:hypothetical protein